MGTNIFNMFGDTSGHSLIPTRDPGAASGSDFVQNNLQLMGAPREQNILEEFLHGNIPDFLRNFTSVTVSNSTDSITYLVTPDYLSIGHDSDYIRMPMTPLTAQKIADKYDCTLPTRKMVNSIWKSAVNKLTPKTIPPDVQISSTARYEQHNELVRQQLLPLNEKVLTAGHKKDVVITDKLSPNNLGQRVAIYGWFYSNGVPIQDLNATDHGQFYADYSHGIRLVANDVIVNGNPMRIKDVFSNSRLSLLVSDEGIVTFTRY